ncbi:hypothetical protein SDC9_198286 [bioreactor metagenome]|uniref:Uncharacterized protein n=1 Tax=bioreactor metagenome TaxID=1076179 RepID=A0A645IQM3_9ZZZZ
MRRPARAAYRHGAPAGARTGDQQVADHGHDDQQRKRKRYAEHIAHADEVPHRVGEKAHGHGLHIFQQQHVHNGPHDDEGDQGRQKGSQPQVSNQQSVDQPHCAACEHRAQYGCPQRPMGKVQQCQCREVAQRKVGAD